MSEDSNHKLVPVGITTGSPVLGQPNAQVFRPLGDDHECYNLVGRIAAEAAGIDFLLDQAIANAAGLDRALAACITGQLTGYSPRFLALLQLCKQRGLPSELLDRINGASGRCSNEMGLRNRAVHDPWLEEAISREPHQFRGKPRRSAEYGLVLVSVDDLNSNLATLCQVREQVNQLVGDIWTALQRT